MKEQVTFEERVNALMKESELTYLYASSDLYKTGFKDVARRIERMHIEGLEEERIIDLIISLIKENRVVKKVLSFFEQEYLEGYKAAIDNFINLNNREYLEERKMIYTSMQHIL